MRCHVAPGIVEHILVENGVSLGRRLLSGCGSVLFSIGLYQSESAGHHIPNGISLRSTEIEAFVTPVSLVILYHKP